MNLDRLISSPVVRIATGVFALLSIGAIAMSQRGDLSEFTRILLLLGIGSGVLTIMGLIFSFRPVYDIWMKIADVLHTIVTVLLFGAIYLLAVPLIVVFVRFSDPLKMGSRSAKEETFWIRRHKDIDDPKSYQRMG